MVQLLTSKPTAAKKLIEEMSADFGKPKKDSDAKAAGYDCWVRHDKQGQTLTISELENEFTVELVKGTGCL